MTVPVISFIGKSGAGKTTLMEKIVVELKRRGRRLATIKHHSHAGFDIDIPGKDSWRYAQAGSDQVIIAAPDKIAAYRLLDRELELDEVLREVQPGYDLILVEGYREAGKPFIEVVRQAHYKELIGDPQHRIAAAADFPLDLDVPQFSLDDAPAIADFILEWIAKNSEASET